MAVLSKALPLTASCLSPLRGSSEVWRGVLNIKWNSHQISMLDLVTGSWELWRGCCTSTGRAIPKVCLIEQVAVSSGRGNEHQTEEPSLKYV